MACSSGASPLRAGTPVANVLLSAWALLVVPLALIIGACAYKGFTLSQTWDAIGKAAEDDAGREPGWHVALIHPA